MTALAKAPWTRAGRQLAIAVALTLIVVAGAAARLVDLEAHPGGLYPDEAAEAMSGRQILRDPGYRPVFLVEDAGREALYAYTVAAGFAIAGDKILTLRVVAALWGVLGILGIWLLARRYGAVAGLAAAAWAAGSLWLIAISRDGMRNTFTPFFCGIALAALLAWHDRPSPRRSVLAGVILGISTLHTYQALKLLPLLVVIWILWLRRSDPPRFKAMVRQSGYAIAGFLVVGAPMIAFAIGNPGAYLGRAIGVSAFNPAIVLETNLVEHVLRTLGMFAFVGDPNERHNVGGLPLLSWPLVILALLGLWRTWRSRKDAAYSLLLLSIPVFMIPPLLATEGGSPHFLRALGLAAPLGVLVGVGVREFVRLVARLAKYRANVRRGPFGPRPLAAAAAALVLATIGLGSAQTYLSRPVAAREEAFRFDLVAMASAATPSDAVIASEFDAFTIQYVHDDPMPLIVRPGQSIDATTVDRVLAVRVEELRAAVGPELASLAEPIAWDSRGQPAVWATPAD